MYLSIITPAEGRGWGKREREREGGKKKKEGRNGRGV